MRITLSPIAALESDTPPVVDGDTLTYRGEVHDLSGLPDNKEVEADLPFVGPIKRVDGVIHLTLQYRYHIEQAEDYQSTDWADYTFDVDGECPDPIKRK